MIDARADVVDLVPMLPDEGGGRASVEVARTLARTFRVRRMRGVTANWHVHKDGAEGFLALAGEMIVDLAGGRPPSRAGRGGGAGLRRAVAALQAEVRAATTERMCRARMAKSTGLAK